MYNILKQLRDKNNKSNRYCRAGCGYEENLNKFDTPGFELNNKDRIDYKGKKKFRVFNLKRTNNRRMNQTSSYLLQSWRANCDVKVLIYDHDPRQINPEDIANVTDYVVSYVNKANQTFLQEKEFIRNLIIG